MSKEYNQIFWEGLDWETVGTPEVEYDEEQGDVRSGDATVRKSRHLYGSSKDEILKNRKKNRQRTRSVRFFVIRQ